MATFGSVPFPISTFQSVHGSEATPADLLVFLQTLATEHLAKPTSEHISSEKDAWVSLILGLTEHFLLSFPAPSFGHWHTLHERILLSEVTLDIIQRVASRVDDAFSWKENHTYSVVFRLMKFIVNLHEWPRPTATDQPSVAVVSADELRLKATNTIVSVLKCLIDARVVESGKRVSSDRNFYNFANRIVVAIKGCCYL